MLTRIAIPVLWLTLAPAMGGQNAAPSSHLVFDDNFEGDIIINEVRVPENGEALYTYYEALGWRGKAAGYGGIQAHPKAHNYIFSIWDHKSHRAPITAVHRGPGTLTENFGGEGTGLKSWNFELGWDTDAWYTLVSRCWAHGDHTRYGYWVRSNKTGEWTHMVTMNVATEDAFFQGSTDAFIEDWLETGVKPRTTHLRKGWKRKREGKQWHAFGSGRYSVNHWDLDPGKRSFNFRTNWNGGVAKDADGPYYFMTAGGAETKPTVANPSRHQIARKQDKPDHAPIRIVSAEAKPIDGKLEIRWEVDPKTLPPFSYEVTLLAEGKGAFATTGEVRPHARNATIPLPAGIKPRDISVRLRCSDILDNHFDLPEFSSAD